jgi:hypothetical protein
MRRVGNAEQPRRSGEPIIASLWGDPRLATIVLDDGGKRLVSHHRTIPSNLVCAFRAIRSALRLP